MSDNQAYATEIARWRVKSGFWPLGDLIASTVEVLEYDKNITSKEAKSLARQIVIPLWNQQLAAQQSWPQDERTIAEKFAAAFESLDKNHRIPARMNFTCCRTCGVSEIGMDRDEEDAVGYAFFHEQTTQCFVQYPGATVMVYYGTFPGRGAECLDVANTVVRALEREGLSVKWSGDTAKAIEVDCDEWRKRLIEEEDDLSYYYDEYEEGEDEK
ncbi:conserved hypothetical protein [Histoplasma capsulatum G186AR]|uniref:DUF6891 domain-containing protein n=1 Tax=Ajellomyces capsulatus (strain G186AR / H82 / ATCC MYA-2454 / RMSCC 2432) TaxID=447093 RepID=C0NP30_AJECG|nr:uncharacterized protein HCBG_04910 [Histoplasma capsulatum G186AR]EEH06690.1 conserved hypothetical protein [Histoplasma capsulatum G186AR]